MPAVQSKTNINARAPADQDNVKARGHLKTRNKDRSNPHRNETIWDRLSQLKRKRSIPELDFKALSPKGQGKKNSVRVDSARKVNAAAVKVAAAKAAKKRQWEVGNAYSRLNIPNRTLTDQDNFMDEMKTSRSLYYTSPRPDVDDSFADVENINPNQLSDTFFECNEIEDFFRTQFPDFENNSDYEFETPKHYNSKDLDYSSVDSVRSHHANTPGILRHFKELLNQEESSRTNILEKSEIALLKEIVKADEQHQKLRRDDYDMLKEILKGHLKEITQQERVIKMALNKIRTQSEEEIEVQTMKVDTAEQPMEDSACVAKTAKVASARCNADKNCSLSDSAKNNNSARISSPKTSRQEVDVIFKNVPTLENEIRILRTLGHKLEETLKKSTGKPITSIEKQSPLILHTVQIRYFTHHICIASMIVFPMGTRLVSIIAQEYQISHQTIDELKLEREFFIPTDLERFTLQRTNFNKLSRNPELLLRRLKPFNKGSKMKFNFIEQDPIFFNHFIAKMCKICSDPIEGHETYIPKNVGVLKKNSSPKIFFLKSGSGDHPDFLFDEVSPSSTNIEEVPVLKDANSSDHSLNRKRKRRRTSTPLLENDHITAKNGLLKTVLLATLQLAILFTVVTAVLYPDLICL